MWLRLAHEHRRAQRIAQHETLRPRVVVEELLGEQDADHVVLAFADHRETRVLGFEDQRQEIRRLVVDRYAIHLRARDHDVAHRSLRHRQHALDHRQRVGVEQPSFERAPEQIEKLAAVFRLARQERRQPFEQRRPVVAFIVVQIFHLFRGTAIRIGIAKRTEQRRFARFHSCRVGSSLVVVALQMQHAVNDEVRAVRA